MTIHEPLTYEREYAVRLVRTNRFPFFALRSVLKSYMLAGPPGMNRYNSPRIPISAQQNQETHTALLEKPLTATDQDSSHNAVTHVTAFSEHERRATAWLPHFRTPFPPSPLSPL